MAFRLKPDCSSNGRQEGRPWFGKPRDSVAAIRAFPWRMERFTPSAIKAERASQWPWELLMANRSGPQNLESRGRRVGATTPVPVRLRPYPATWCLRSDNGETWLVWTRRPVRSAGARSTAGTLEGSVLTGDSPNHL